MVKKQEKAELIYCPKIADIIRKAAHIEAVQSSFIKNYKTPKEFSITTLYISDGGTQRTKVCLPAIMTWQQACEAYPELANYKLQIMPCPPFKKHFDVYVLGEHEKTPKIYYI